MMKTNKDLAMIITTFFLMNFAFIQYYIIFNQFISVEYILGSLTVLGTIASALFLMRQNKILIEDILLNRKSIAHTQKIKHITNLLALMDELLGRLVIKRISSIQHDELEVKSFFKEDAYNGFSQVILNSIQTDKRINNDIIFLESPYEMVRIYQLLIIIMKDCIEYESEEVWIVTLIKIESLISLMSKLSKCDDTENKYAQYVIEHENYRDSFDDMIVLTLIPLDYLKSRKVEIQKLSEFFKQYKLKNIK